MVSILTIAPKSAKAYEHLTFPAIRPILQEPEGKELVIAAAHAGEDAIGLAFGWGGPRREFELMSIYVVPLMRCLGIGTRLLAEVETGFRQRGYRIGVHRYTVRDDEQGFARFLINRGWSKPPVRQIICKTSLELAFQTPWLISAELPEGYTVKPWEDVTKAERKSIRRRHKKENPWYAKDQNPFKHEKDFHGQTSLAMMRGGEVVGWVISHPLGEDTLRWTVSFVADELQGAGRIIPLWLEVARRQEKYTDMKYFIWGVPVEHPRMLRFATRRMKPWLLSMSYACTSIKELSAG